MGRELQKKKKRSSTAKVKHKPKSKRVNVRGNATVAANWDQTLTLAQNYCRLGLTSRLNGRSGGIEKLGSSGLEEVLKLHSKPQELLSLVSKTPTTLVPSEVRVERDPSTGAILRIVREPSEYDNPLKDPLNDFSDDSGSGNFERPVTGGIIKELEEEASMEVKKRPRKQSKREEEWISDLVKKYGDNYASMVRDRKLNPYQQGEGDLKRRIKKWTESTGG